MRKADLTHAVWRTSSRSSGNGQCVEVALLGDVVAARDSKNPNGGVLIVGDVEWTQFLKKIRDGNG
ncbi:DUF397 domain-containing protein [Umezawaea sp.]|jgi:hypothetical protein|uniref:DUF397 domain-containing protein n=1 Tax=Umezawaea sp. TaxID=1955258 RepID=UPI002ED1A6BF